MASDGDLWYFRFDGTAGDVIAYTSTDGGQTWSSGNTWSYGGGTFTAQAFQTISWVQDGDTAHVVWYNTSNTAIEVRYNTINLSTGSWGTEQVIENSTGGESLSKALHKLAVVVRSDGDVVVIYGTQAEKVKGSIVSRMAAAVDTGSGFGTPVVLGTGVQDDFNFIGGTLLMSDDDIGVITDYATSNRLTEFQVSGSWTGSYTSAASTIAGAAPMGVGMDGPGTYPARVGLKVGTFIPGSMEETSAPYDDDGIDTVATYSTNEFLCVAADTVDDYWYGAFLWPSNQDLYWTVDTGSGWGTPTQWKTGTYGGTWPPYCNVFTHSSGNGGARVLGIVYYESGTGMVYDEVVIAAGPIPVTQPSEADSSQPATTLKTYAVGQALETDTAQPADGVRNYAAGQALETDSAQPAQSGTFLRVSEATIAVAANGDDGYVMNDATFVSGGSGIYAGNVASNINDMWLRFPGAPGVSFLTAFLNLYSVGTGGAALLRVFGIDESDHNAPTDLSSWAADHALHTAASVDWDVDWSSSGWFASPDLSDILNEIPLAVGNALGLHVDDDGSSSPGEYAGVYSYENGSLYPTLDLTWILTEQDTAQEATPVKTYAVGQAVETDSAQAVSVAKTFGVYQAYEIDAPWWPEFPRHMPVEASLDDAVTWGTVSSRQKIATRFYMDSPLGAGESLAGIRVRLAKVGTPTDGVNVSIRASRDGAKLAEATIDAADIPTYSTFDYFYVEFDTAWSGPYSQGYLYVQFERSGSLSDSNYFVCLRTSGQKFDGASGGPNPYAQAWSYYGVWQEDTPTSPLAWRAFEAVGLSSMENATAVLVGGGTVAGQALEAESANAATASKTYTVGQATETDSAFTASSVAIVPASQSVETDTAQPAAAAKTYSVGQATETDTAFGPDLAIGVGQAVETDTAFSPDLAFGVGQALESDTAFSPDLAIQLAFSLETDSANAATSAKVYTVNQAVETDSAFAAAAAFVKDVGQSLETDSAFAPTAAKTYTAGQALETDAAFGPDLAFQIAQAFETDSAQPASVSSATIANQALESDSALASSALKVYTVGQALESDASFPATTLEAHSVAQALESDSALAKSGMVYGPTLALETDFSLQVGVQDVETATQALESDLSQPASSSKVYQVAQALESDSAQTATPVKIGLPGQALESDSAFSPDLAFQIGQALETDSAFAASSASGIVAGQSVETDSAQPSVASKVFTVAQAVESDSAQPATTLETYTAAQSLETDTSQPATTQKAYTASQALETDSAASPGALKTYPVGQAVETDTSNPVSVSAATTAGLATETDAAFTATLVGGTQVNLASETDTANQVAVSFTHIIAQALETDSALVATPVELRQVSQAVETDSAFSADIAFGTAQALEADISFPASTAKTYTVTQPSSGESAQPAEGVENRDVGLASEVSSAFAVTVAKVFVAGLAQETNLALNFTIEALVGLAVETDTALAAMLEPLITIILGRRFPGRPVRVVGRPSRRVGVGTFSSNGDGIPYNEFSEDH
jgi:hypothetical protein